MKLRLGAAVLLAALMPLTAVTASSPAGAGTGVDITPPAVGSCHDLTWAEVMPMTEPDPAVDCTEQHTTITTGIVQFAEAPRWRDTDATIGRAMTPCLRARLEAFDGKAKALQMSAYTGYFFYPSKAQRDAGATWVRCDTGLMAGESVPELPTDRGPDLGALPLPDSLARCRKGEGGDFLLTTCDRPHHFQATYAGKFRGTAYPGGERIKRWTIRMCSNRVGRSLGYIEPPTREEWRAGLQYSICFRRTR